MSMSPSEHLIMRFVADILDRIMGLTEHAERQRAVQAFIDELIPWFPPDALLKAKSRLFDHLDIHERTEIISVEFSLAGHVCFRAWYNRLGLNPLMSSS